MRASRRNQLIMYQNVNSEDDTLGGRIWRAREATGMNEIEFARAMGIKKETVVAWENDRSEPRANRLLTMAGVLGVSPAWLLHGIGMAPLDDPVSSELGIMRSELERIKEYRDRTSIAILNMEKAIDRLAKNEQQG
jgi:transcriptional regulator with XRE-family HTH domain